MRIRFLILFSLLMPVTHAQAAGVELPCPTTIAKVGIAACALGLGIGALAIWETCIPNGIPPHPADWAYRLTLGAGGLLAGYSIGQSAWLERTSLATVYELERRQSELAERVFVLIRELAQTIELSSDATAVPAFEEHGDSIATYLRALELSIARGDAYWKTYEGAQSRRLVRKYIRRLYVVHLYEQFIETLPYAGLGLQ